MRRLMSAFAIAGLVASPAFAQSQSPAGQAPAKAKTVEKVVCEKIAAERSTGSRLSSTTRVCKTVQVPADDAGRTGGRSGSDDQHAH